MLEPELVKSARYVLEHGCCCIDPLKHTVTGDDPATLVEDAEHAESMGQVSEDPGVQLLDAFTSSMVVQVWDALSERARNHWLEKLTGIPAGYVVGKLWKVVR